MAAAIQYFPDLPKLITALKRVLKPGGEIHILDSPFYPGEQKRLDVREATRRYYSDMDVPEMALFYHHHCWSEIAGPGGENLNAAFIPRLLQKLHWLAPFPWVRIRF